MNLGDLDSPRAPVARQRDIVDRWLLSHLADAVAEATAAFEGHDYCRPTRPPRGCSGPSTRPLPRDDQGPAHGLRRPDADAPGGPCGSRSGCCSGLRAFAPFVTERMYQQFYRAYEDAVSLHLTRWPVADERWRGDRPAVEAVDQLAVILDATRVLRSGQRPATRPGSAS